MAQKLVKCKSCGEMIAKSAKTCPHCGAKRKHSVFGIILIIIGVCILLGIIFGKDQKPHKVGDTGTKSPEQNVEQKTDNTTTFGVGEKVELNDIIVTLVDVSTSSGGNYMTPEDGKEFIICEFEIENNSSKDIAVSSVLSFDAYVDDYATNMSLSATLSTDKSQLDGTIAAGKKMNGVVGYEADPSWKTIEIRFTPDFWSGKNFIFEAQH